MRVLLPFVLLVAMFLPGRAAPSPLVPANPRLEEHLRLEWNRRLWVDGKHAGPYAVVVRFSGERTPAQVRQLEAAGVTLDRVDGRVAHVGPFYGARVSPAALIKLLDMPEVERVFAPPAQDVRPTPPGNPFDRVHAWTGAAEAWERKDATGRHYLGQGVTLCDLDGAADLFHPLMFHADGGLYAWLDVNHNGRFDPGQDAVDLDGTGAVTAGTVLHKLGGGIVDPYGTLGDEDVPFHTARHWLYADSNGNGQPDHGAAAGFSEDTPAYGEPLFLVDDVNDNGVLDVGEKLLRLKTSKYKGVFRPSTGRSYARGVDLVSVPVNTDASHGSGVGAILVGGVPGHSWVQGLAPGADLLLVVQDSAPGEIDYTDPRFQQNLVSALDWARGLGTRIFVHEYGSAVGEFADGSGDWEQVLDTLTAQGSLQATAAHNFAGNEGRARLVLAAGQQLAQQLTVLDGSAYGYPVQALYGTLRWRGTQTDLEVTLTLPDGVTLSAQEENFQGQDVVFGSRQVSSRGTGMVDFIYGFLDAAGTAYEAVPPGTYTLNLRNAAAESRDVFTYVTDESMYAWFVSLAGEHSDVTSMAHPSTADSAVAVAAFSVNTLYDTAREGDLAYYSGRGPRIDGLTTIGLAAPADHYSATPETESVGPGHYQVFGGTSGALPQVAGAAALLLGKEPELTPAQVKERLRSSARADATTGTTPSDAWGAGRLDVPRLLFGTTPPANAAPVLRVSAPASVTLSGGSASVTVDASASTDDQDPLASLSFRFDVEYDGTWESLGTTPQLSTTFTKSGLHTVLVEVEDSVGGLARGLVSVQVVDPAAVSSSSSAGTGSTSAAGTSSSTAGTSSSTSGFSSSGSTASSAAASGASTSASAASSAGTVSSSSGATSSTSGADSGASTGGDDGDGGGGGGCGSCGQANGAPGVLVLLALAWRRRRRSGGHEQA